MSGCKLDFRTICLEYTWCDYDAHPTNHRTHKCELGTLINGSDNNSTDDEQHNLLIAEQIIETLLSPDYICKEPEVESEVYALYSRLLNKTAQTKHEWQKCAKMYKKAIQHDPHDADLHAEYALILSDKLDKHKQADKEYKEAIKLDCCDATFNRNYAIFLSNTMNKYQESMKYHKKSKLKSNEITTDVLYSYAKALLNIDNFHEAINILTNDKLQNDPFYWPTCKRLVKMAQFWLMFETFIANAIDLLLMIIIVMTVRLLIN